MNLLDYLADASLRSKLPAGMRNNNPGNIKFTSTRAFPGVVGPSVNTDQGDPQAVFSSPEAGMAAMFNLAKRKYQGGKTTTNSLIAGNMGWTPGNYQAAANVARTMGIGPDDDIGLNDPSRASSFLKALIRQEHGNSGGLYTDDMIASAISGAGLPTAPTTPIETAYSQPRRPTNPAMQAIDNQTTGSITPMAQDPQQPARSGGLFGEGGFLDFNNPKTLIAMQLIANGQRAPGEMFDGIPQIAAYGARMSEAKQEKADALKKENQTAAWIRAKKPEFAQYLDAGIPAADVFNMAMKPAPTPERQWVELPDGTYGWADKNSGQFSPIGNAAKPEKNDPMSTVGKLASDYNKGLITEDQYKAGLQDIAPKGMTIESDGNGGFRMVQGPVGANGAGLNVEQGKNTGFLLRAQDSNKIITNLEGEGTSLANKAAQAIPMGLGNYVLSDDAQKLDQAKRDFINAVLRNESGAVISPEEFANADRQYFPQPGDSEAVLQQKRHNRENAIAGFRIRSGPGVGVADQQSQQSDPLGIR